MRVVFSKTARKQLEDWSVSDRNIVDKIDELLSDIQKYGLLKGKGKPEQLRHFKNPPRFSRHITKQDRLVYSPMRENGILILSCKGHYEDT
jgi:toxin YoeB